MTSRERIEALVSAMTGRACAVAELRGGNGYFRLACGPYESEPYRTAKEGEGATKELLAVVETAAFKAIGVDILNAHTSNRFAQRRLAEAQRVADEERELAREASASLGSALAATDALTRALFDLYTENR